MQNDVTPESHDPGMAGSSRALVTYDNSNEVDSQSQIRNQPPSLYHQDQNLDAPSAGAGSHGNTTHAGNISDTAQADNYGDTAHAAHQSPRKQTNTEQEVSNQHSDAPNLAAKISSSEHVTPETDQSNPSLKAAVDTAPPPTTVTQDEPPVKDTSKPPTGLSSFKRHMVETTYSSDDDDVFLPDPPSKSQADRCTISADTEEGEGEGEGGASPVADVTISVEDVDAPVVREEGEEMEEGEGGEKGKDEGSLFVLAATEEADTGKY